MPFKRVMMTTGDNKDAAVDGRLAALRRLARAGAVSSGPRLSDDDVVALLVDGLFETTGATRVRQVSLDVGRHIVYDVAGSTVSSPADRLDETAFRQALASMEAILHFPSPGEAGGLVVPLLTAPGAVEVFMVELRPDAMVTPTDVEMATILRDQAWAALTSRDANIQASQDPLTGCLNRAGLVAQLERDLARTQRLQSRLSCVMLDLDDLKVVNDVKGHQVGDHVIRLVAEVIVSQCRPYDSCARYGGDEFFVILPESGIVDAARAAERMRAAFATSVARDAQLDFSMAVTAGVAEWQSGDKLEDLVQRADEALLAAKRRGKNRIQAAPERPES